MNRLHKQEAIRLTYKANFLVGLIESAIIHDKVLPIKAKNVCFNTYRHMSKVEVDNSYLPLDSTVPQDIGDAYMTSWYKLRAAVEAMVEIKEA
jgi:hypothetical protein